MYFSVLTVFIFFLFLFLFKYNKSFRFYLIEYVLPFLNKFYIKLSLYDFFFICIFFFIIIIISPFFYDFCFYLYKYDRVVFIVNAFFQDYRDNPDSIVRTHVYPFLDKFSQINLNFKKYNISKVYDEEVDKFVNRILVCICLLIVRKVIYLIFTTFLYLLFFILKKIYSFLNKFSFVSYLFQKFSKNHSFIYEDIDIRDYKKFSLWYLS